MLITHLHRLLTTPTAKISKFQVMFWFSLSLTFAAIYGVLGWRQAFSGEYVVQDDARQHVFWMLRFLDPELFPQDLIADYFQSLAPVGYSGFYQLMASVGINPLVLNKLLPAILGLITTSYCFSVCLEILPVPATGFIATLLLNQNLWMKDDLVSGTPRAFAYPLLLAFLYYLLRRSLFPCLAAIALLGLFYPQFIFICAGILILRLWDWENGCLRLSPERHPYLFCAAGLGVVLLVLLLYALKSSEFGPTITVTEARKLPEFFPGGRVTFFHKAPTDYWLTGKGSSMFPKSLFTPVTLCAGLLLPLLLPYPSRFPLLRQLTTSFMLLPQMLLASIAMFFAAHALLFKLYLPSRYTGHTFRIVVSILAAIALTALLDAVFHACEQKAKPDRHCRQSLALASTAIVGTALILYPSFVKSFPLNSYIVGAVPPLYEFFQQQPKNILIASLAEETNNLPVFSQRSILVGREYAIPYQVGYYRQFRQRTVDLIRAQYNVDLAQVQNFIQTYGVDYWLLDRAAFTPEYVANHNWLRQYQPAATEALVKLQQGKLLALSRVMKRCSVFETEGLVVLKAECITKQPQA